MTTDLNGSGPALDGAELLRMLRVARDRVVLHRRWLDRLNVFPVADADTGRNMVATLDAVVDTATEESDGAHPAVGDAAIRAARGNSGVILAEWLRAFLPAGGESITRAMTEAAEAARRAVHLPVEGTIVTVAGDAAVAAQGTTALAIVDAARNEAEASLARTTGMLEVLARHRVVDAGGAGLVCVLDGFVVALGGSAPDSRETPIAPSRSGSTVSGAVDRTQVEVMVTITCSADDVVRLEDEWNAIGDSVSVAGGGGLWRLHVHTGQPDDALSLADRRGSVTDRLVESLAEDSR